ncbi:tetratricopeptide repeat protein [Actinoplanes missouriensis]|uniref:tetratricopeptide repeat protein n=1 Tax=Actinoplanes missouriensis TaxID=1866 RepID=UPI00030A20FB|nr:tetratricopeptide repeat protein [Actinoplanes missouriensis]
MPPLTQALERARRLVASGDPDGARLLLERAVELGQTRLGEDHPEVLSTQLHLAALSRRIGDPAGARRVLEEAYAAGRPRHGDASPIMLRVSYDLGQVAEELGNRHEARKAFTRVAQHGPAALGAQHQAVARARAYLQDPSPVRVEAAPPNRQLLDPPGVYRVPPQPPPLQQKKPQQKNPQLEDPQLEDPQLEDPQLEDPQPEVEPAWLPEMEDPEPPPQHGTQSRYVEPFWDPEAPDEPEETQKPDEPERPGTTPEPAPPPPVVTKPPTSRLPPPPHNHDELLRSAASMLTAYPSIARTRHQPEPKDRGWAILLVVIAATAAIVAVGALVFVLVERAGTGGG